MDLGLADMTGRDMENRRREVDCSQTTLSKKRPNRGWDMGISAVGTNANTRLGSWRALGRPDTLERCCFTRVGSLAVAIQPYFWCSDALAAFRGNDTVVSWWFLVIPCLHSIL